MRPPAIMRMPLCQSDNTALTFPDPQFFIGTGGAIRFYYLDTGTVEAHCYGFYALPGALEHEDEIAQPMPAKRRKTR